MRTPMAKAAFQTASFPFRPCCAVDAPSASTLSATAPMLPPISGVSCSPPIHSPTPETLSPALTSPSPSVPRWLMRFVAAMPSIRQNRTHAITRKSIATIRWCVIRDSMNVLPFEVALQPERAAYVDSP